MYDIIEIAPLLKECWVCKRIYTVTNWKREIEIMSERVGLGLCYRHSTSKVLDCFNNQEAFLTGHFNIPQHEDSKHVWYVIISSKFHKSEESLLLALSLSAPELKFEIVKKHEHGEETYWALRGT